VPPERDFSIGIKPVQAAVRTLRLMNAAVLKPHTLTHYQRLVLDALRRIVGALDEALDTQALAAPACMAPLHFHRIFRGLVGETPLQLHRRLRLERAASRLAGGEDTVLRVALDAGYETHEAFTRVFRDAFGRTPTEHRALAKAATGVAGDCAAPRSPSHRLQAACGLHVEGDHVSFPAQEAAVFIHLGALNMDVQIENRPALRVAAVPHRGPYNTIGDAFGQLGRLAGAAGLLAHGDAFMVALYHDDPETVPAPQLRSSAGVTIPETAVLPPTLQELRLPAGRWARTLHRGSYRGLGDCWQRLIGQWLPHSGLRMGAGDCYELYLNDPSITPEESLETLLFVPLAD